MTYRKIGGLHYFTVGRLGLTLFVKRRTAGRWARTTLTLFPNHDRVRVPWFKRQPAKTLISG